MTVDYDDAKTSSRIFRGPIENYGQGPKADQRSMSKNFHLEESIHLGAISCPMDGIGTLALYVKTIMALVI